MTALFLNIRRQATSQTLRHPYEHRMKRLLKSLLFLCLLHLPGAFAQDDAAEPLESAEPPDELAVMVGTTHPEMLAAIREARSTLDEFLDIASHPEPEMSTFKLKIVLREDKNIEYFWVTPFQVSAEGFEGTLANAPDLLRNVSLGDTIRFTRGEIIDWGYVRDGRQVGSRTVCVLFKYMEKWTADYFRQNNGFDC